jgi:hypothetical protein
MAASRANLAMRISAVTENEKIYFAFFERLTQ